MEKGSNVKRSRSQGRVGDPRSPSSGGPILPIGVELVHIISELDPEVNKSALKGSNWRKEVFEVVLKYLNHIGVQSSLLQSGKILTSDCRDTGKEYFFAGNYLLEEEDEIIYEELPKSKGLFQGVIIGKKSEIAEDASGKNEQDNDK